MMSQPEMLWELAKQHQRDLIGDADQRRLLSSARRHRRNRRHRSDQ
jgi:hypothetical protein